MNAEISDEEKVLRRYAQCVWDLQRLTRNHPTWSVTWHREGLELSVRFARDGHARSAETQTRVSLEDDNAPVWIMNVAHDFANGIASARPRRKKDVR